MNPTLFRPSSACRNLLVAGVAALGLTAAASESLAQGRAGHGLEVLEAARQPPPDVIEIEQATRQMPAPPAHARAEIAELVEQIARQRGGRERLDEARRGGRPAHAMAASRQPPPDVAEFERQKPLAPPSSARPSHKELEQAIGRQAGGREKLERARQGGRPDRAPPRASLRERTGKWIAWLPALVSPAHAAGKLSVTLTPRVTGDRGQHDGLSARSSSAADALRADIVLWGSYVSPNTPTSIYGYAGRVTMTWDSATVSRVERPFVRLGVYAPREGFYIINTRAATESGVQLRRWQSGSGYVVMQTFDAEGMADRPALVYLAQGQHYFYWVSPNWYSFYSASVDSFP